MIETLEHLRNHLNIEFGVTKKWPNEFWVNAKVYGEACQAVFDWHIKNNLNRVLEYHDEIELSLGKNGGLMFKNVELRIIK